MRNSPDQIAPFIWAAVANEMAVTPRLTPLAHSYIMDLERGMVLHVYDDRGMDLAATRPELLRPCYEQLNGWLLDHDRARMDAIFASGAVND